MKDKETYNVFDFYRNITKEHEPLPKEIVNEFFNVIEMNRLMSFDPAGLALASELNKFPFRISKWAAYLLYFHGIQKRKYTPFLNLKKGDKPVLLNKMKTIFPDYNTKKLLEVLPLIAEKITTIELVEGGVEKVKKEKKKND